jgi:regulator of protease activity HflC (stomatin/prohibitin superfamily)
MTAGLVVLLVLAFLVLLVVGRSIRIIPQARASVVERLGRYSRTLEPGLAVVVPFVDRVRPLIDLREQVVSFPPQPVITEDNLVVQIDSVIYYQVTDPKAASYEIANFIQAIEQLTVTTLRNVSGGMTLEQTLTSRDSINSELRIVLDEATGKWGIRVNRVELKAVDPPVSIQEAMEKQMRAERDRRAAILQAEGVKQSQILTAEGEKQSAILRAEGQREAQALYAEGQAKAIETVFGAIHAGDPDPKLLAYQYLQMLPQIAQGDANKVWIIPSEITQALGSLGSVVENVRGAAERTGPGTGGHASSADSARPAVGPGSATEPAESAGPGGQGAPDAAGATAGPGAPDAPAAPSESGAPADPVAGAQPTTQQPTIPPSPPGDGAA